MTLHLAGDTDEPAEMPATTLASSNLVQLAVVTRHNIPIERVLKGAKDADLACLITIGETAEGELFFSSSHADGGSVLWLLKKAERALLRCGGVE